MTPAALTSTLQRLGLSQAECARLLGVTPGAVTRWAKGNRPVPGPVVRLLAVAERNTDTVWFLRHNSWPD
jgi:transcriptional regulator with XRE-family HTH domain